MGEGSEGGQTDGVGWYVGGWESARRSHSSARLVIMMHCQCVQQVPRGLQSDISARQSSPGRVCPLPFSVEHRCARALCVCVCVCVCVLRACVRACLRVCVCVLRVCVRAACECACGVCVCVCACACGVCVCVCVCVCK